MLPLEHSAILLTFIKLPFVVKTFVLSIFELMFYTGFTVQNKTHVLILPQLQMYMFHAWISSGDSSIYEFGNEEITTSSLGSTVAQW